jgi:hypothetical protein
MKTLTAPFYSIYEFPPENKRWCLCILKDGKIRTGWYEKRSWSNKGIFWKSENDDAGGIGEVEYWTYADDIKIS